MATTTPHRTARAVTYQEDIITSSAARKTLAVGRIIIGWVFLWAFIDKLFGLGFATPAERAMLNGGTPAQGYINGIEGPFAGFFQLFANPFGDYLFMLGLLGIGVALITGCGLKIAAVTGTLLMLFMYLAALPFVGEHGTNPITDSHWVEAMLLIIPAVTLAGDTWGLGKWWGGKVGNSWLR
ncbi:DoxX family protein [Georgenia sp. EYE_87]|uniref:DoxX family protein n=1 Tax=Georgenia sp. EYE_87 TaxID=2853448 RepID=UPI0020053FAE|nr:DoxX family protein [Georgenia sp. EYE_87]MCK6212418.1 DoxX family protein [Georgenia sp. EYE_87]